MAKIFQKYFQPWHCMLFPVILLSCQDVTSSIIANSSSGTVTNSTTVFADSGYTNTLPVSTEPPTLITTFGSTLESSNNTPGSTLESSNDTSVSTSELPSATYGSNLEPPPDATSGSTSGSFNTTSGSIIEPFDATSGSTFKVTTTGDNSTTANPGDDSSVLQYVGFIIAGVAVLLYGSNYAPVKKFETGDGMFFQWIICGGALLVGLIVQLIRNTKNFHPLVMIGGLFWSTGNVCVVPIIKTIGLGLGLCIWAMTSLLSGWASSRFGWFGLAASTQIGNYVFNTIGVVVAASSSIIFAFVKNDVDNDCDVDPPGNILSVSLSTIQTDLSLGDSFEKTCTIQNQLNLNQGKCFFLHFYRGIFLSVFSGLLYGQMFTPAVYLQQQGDSQNALDYVFACFCGVYLTSTVYFIIYIIYMKNKPIVYPKAILPGMISGAMWGTATAGWFVANQVLSPAIAFPIITTGPSVIASLWGVFVFKEIRGIRNIGLLLLGFVFVFTGAILTAFSEKS